MIWNLRFFWKILLIHPILHETIVSESFGDWQIHKKRLGLLSEKLTWSALVFCSYRPCILRIESGVSSGWSWGLKVSWTKSKFIEFCCSLDFSVKSWLTCVVLTVRQWDSGNSFKLLSEGDFSIKTIDWCDSPWVDSETGATTQSLHLVGTSVMVLCLCRWRWKLRCMNWIALL